MKATKFCPPSFICSYRYRFLELKYRRCEQVKEKSGDIVKPARIETVVIFLPDIYSCMPNRTEWEILQQQYKQACEKFLADDDDDEEDDDEVVEIVPAAEETTAKDGVDNVGDASVSVENKTDVVDVKESIKDDHVTAPSDVKVSGNNDDENSEMPIVILLQSTDHKFIFLFGIIISLSLIPPLLLLSLSLSHSFLSLEKFFFI